MILTSPGRYLSFFVILVWVSGGAILAHFFLIFFNIAKAIDGSWSAFGEWSKCKNTCGHEKKTKTRTCSNPAPANGGAKCVGSSTETDDCGHSPCCKFDPPNGRFEMTALADVG